MTVAMNLDILIDINMEDEHGPNEMEIPLPSMPIGLFLFGVFHVDLSRTLTLTCEMMMQYLSHVFSQLRFPSQAPFLSWSM